MLGNEPTFYQYVSFNQYPAAAAVRHHRVNTIVPLDANETCKMVVAAGPIEFNHQQAQTAVAHYSFMTIALVAARS